MTPRAMLSSGMRTVITMMRIIMLRTVAMIGITSVIRWLIVPCILRLKALVIWLSTVLSLLDLLLIRTTRRVSWGKCPARLSVYVSFELIPMLLVVWLIVLVTIMPLIMPCMTDSVASSGMLPWMRAFRACVTWVALIPRIRWFMVFSERTCLDRVCWCLGLSYR